MPRTGLFAELRRRHVWRVAVAYAVGAWLLVQIATQVFPFFDIPNWAVRLVVVLVAVGFPAAVALAWVYEITPEGIRRTESPDSPDARPEQEHRQIRRKLNAFIAGALILAVAVLGWRVLAFRHAPVPVMAKAATAIGPDSAAGAAASGPHDAGSADAAQRNPGPLASQPIPAKSIAVLPFENLSDDKELLTYRREYQRALDLLDQIPDTPDNFEAASLKPLQQARLYRLMGDAGRARQSYAQALPALRQRLKAEYDIWVALVSTYVADAALGLDRTSEGLEAIARAQAVIAGSRDSMNVPNIMRIDAALYVRAGRPDLAVPLLAKALASPGVGSYYSPVLLWLDPEWDPVRGDPRFEDLLKQYVKYKPAIVYPAPPAS